MTGPFPSVHGDGHHQHLPHVPGVRCLRRGSPLPRTPGVVRGAASVPALHIRSFLGVNALPPSGARRQKCNSPRSTVSGVSSSDRDGEMLRTPGCNRLEMDLACSALGRAGSAKAGLVSGPGGTPSLLARSRGRATEEMYANPSGTRYGRGAGVENAKARQFVDPGEVKAGFPWMQGAERRGLQDRAVLHSEHALQGTAPRPGDRLRTG
jgi:hypothetical protein